jgi:antibiotic biosynthesis monooxygenase (ABM) superfamily enzyme
MFNRDRAFLALFVWLGVYPAVLFMTWLLSRFDWSLSLPVRVFLTTIVTVPIIEFVVMRFAKRLAAKAEEAVGFEGTLREKFTEED